MDKSITLPPDEIFRNLENAKRFAIDIGIITYKLPPFFCSCSQYNHLWSLDVAEFVGQGCAKTC